MRNLIKPAYLLVGFAWLLACGQANRETSPPQKDVGEITLASLKLRDLEGSELPLSSLSGKRVFVNFWATWCKPCLAEMPSISAATEALSGENVIFIAASDEKLERIKNFREGNDFKFEILSTQADMASLGIFALPATFIFDEQGKLVYKETGARQWNSQESIELITQNQKL